MIHIVVDDQQAKRISESRQYLEVRDKLGNHLGYVAHGFTDQDIEIAKQRFVSDQPRLSTKQTIDRLRQLEAE
jgi:hypothetical protein